MTLYPIPPLGHRLCAIRRPLDPPQVRLPLVSQPISHGRALRRLINADVFELVHVGRETLERVAAFGQDLGEVRV